MEEIAKKVQERRLKWYGLDKVKDDIKEKRLSGGGSVRPCYMEACVIIHLLT